MNRPLVEQRVAVKLLPFIVSALRIANDPKLLEELKHPAGGASGVLTIVLRNCRPHRMRTERQPLREMGSPGADASSSPSPSTGAGIASGKINGNRNYSPCNSCRRRNARASATSLCSKFILRCSTDTLRNSSALSFSWHGSMCGLIVRPRYCICLRSRISAW